MKLAQGSEVLLDLVKKAYKGDVMLPDFQRNFVWARQDVEDLLKSLLEDMFIGNFLIHIIDPFNPPFKTIPIEGAELLNGSFKAQPNILILDGQQRLSSIFYALYSPDLPLRNASNPYAFFINIRAIIEDDIENSVFSTSKRWRYYNSLHNEDGVFNIESLKKEEIIPCTFLKEDFTDIWYKHYKDGYSDEEDKKVRDQINNIINYDVLTLVVPLSEQPENIAVLFERINRTGVKLSIFDLLVARLYKFINLRTEWEEAYDNYDNIKIYSGKNIRDTQIPYYFIQALALKNGMSIKAREMLKINDKILNKKSWEELVELVNNKVLVRYLDINEYGIGNIDKWLPYTPMIIPLIAFLLNKKYDIDKVNKWYWASVFTERFASSVDSKITKDYKEVLSWWADDTKKPEPVKELLNDIENDNYTLWDKSNSGNAIYKGVFNQLFINDAYDFYDKDKIKYNKTELDDHHIFPRKFLEEKGVNDYVNSIMNKTLIHNTTNRSISKKAPGDYIKEMLSQNNGNEKKVKEIFSRHFIDDEIYEIMKKVTQKTKDSEVAQLFEDFIDKREALVIKRIKKLID